MQVEVKEAFKNITTGNVEYAAQSVCGGKRFKVYYCHSYSAWKKVVNENHRRLMRWFLKKTDFTGGHAYRRPWYCPMRRLHSQRI